MGNFGGPKMKEDLIIQRIIELYPDKRAADVADQVGVSLRKVRYVAQRYGLRKSDEFKKSEASGRVLKGKADRGISGRFKKGDQPWNKGLNVPSTEGMKATQFKKGMIPHNAKYDGHERINVDGYIEVRIRPGKYLQKHRMVWEAAKGEIPKGMLVVFKDGNKLNCDLENLELITKSENMKRNTIHRYSEELKPIVILIGKVKNKAHEKSNRRPKKSPVRTA